MIEETFENLLKVAEEVEQAKQAGKNGKNINSEDSVKTSPEENGISETEDTEEEQP